MAYGDTWVEQLAAPEGDYRGLASSAAGDVLYAANYDYPLTLLKSTDRGATWSSVRTSAIGSFTGRGRYVACSGDGQAVYMPTNGGAIHVSLDGGSTWNTYGGTKNWDCVACSADGSVAYAVTYTQQEAYLSTDSGETWTLIESIASGIADYSYVGCACSSNGSVVYLCTLRGVLKSTDSGATWNVIVAEDLNGGETIHSVATSADGSCVFIGTDNSIFVSTNSGTSFAQASVAAADCYSIACSSDGSRALGVGGSDSLYVTEDSGATWTAVGPTSNSWSAVAVSGNGALLSAGQYWSRLFTSDNVISGGGTTVTLPGGYTYRPTPQYEGTYWVDRFFPGQPIGNQLMLFHVLAQSVDFTAGLASSQAACVTAPDAETVYSITANGIEVGTVTFAASETVGTFAAPSDFTLMPGGLLAIVAPSSPDASQADITFTLVSNGSIGVGNPRPVNLQGRVHTRCVVVGKLTQTPTLSGSVNTGKTRVNGKLSVTHNLAIFNG